ncbi:unnamed protein product [Penicillium salamii]|nr:unnamed protein product [Penicillium salamii]CAG8662920.1 unnamed protein product [Penicillium salamii]
MSNPNLSSERPAHRMIYFRVDIPPEETCTLLRRVQQHSKDSRFTNLAGLLEGCVVTLRDELTRTPSSLHCSAPHFDNLLALAEHPASLQGPFATAFRQALSVTVQVAAVIGFHESNGLPYRPSATSMTLLGVGVGLLAAAAVSAAPSLPDLVELTLRAIRVAFRLGLYVNQVSSQFEPEGNALARDSWSFAVSDMTVEEIQHEIDRYNTETLDCSRLLKDRPEFCKLYIGATLGMTTCISAPPSQLRRAFRESPALSSSRHMPLPVFNGLYHASHIYDQSAIEELLHDVAVGTERTPISVISPLTGKCFIADRIGQLLVEIAVEFLTGAIHTDQVNAGAVEQLTQAGAQHCLFQILHISPFSNGLAAAIHSAIPSLSVEQEVLFEWIPREFGKRRPRTAAHSKIAIVGMACRMPGGANSLDEFWKLMEEGRDVHCRVPADRFDIDAHYDPTAQLMNSTQTPYGNFIDRPGYLDASFFHMSPREAEQTDPMHRLALVTAYEALEMSGYAPDRTPSSYRQRVGTYYGQAADDYRELNNSQNGGTYAVPAGERGFANGRINYFFKFCGPSLNIDTACSSSSAAVHTACNALWAGEVDMALAGGLNVITDPDNFAGLCSSHFLSRTGQCKVWDRDADGYCRGDGIGCVVLKRLEDAEADNDNILGVILSAATNHSANAISITHPHAGAQIDNYRNVMYHAAVDPRDVEYVELHGTGTQAGDLEECTSIREVFAPLAPRRRVDQRLRLGSIKSNIGHGEASAGIASIIKLLLMYQRNQIPPHVGIKTVINPTLPKDLEARNMGLTMALTPWPRKTDTNRRLAVVNGFGAHGGNTTILFEDAPSQEERCGPQLSSHVLCVSAKSSKSFRDNLEALHHFLGENPNTDIGDLSYTTCARRMHHAFRMAAPIRNVAEARSCLEVALAGISSDPNRVLPVPPLGRQKVAFTFTGQGSLYNGAGAGLYKHVPYFRSQIERLDSLAQKCGFPSVLPLVTGQDSAETTSAAEPLAAVQSPLVTQLAIVIIEIGLGRLWMALGVQPCAVVGHSLGEYAALVISGALSALDAIILVGERVRLLMAALTPGSHAMLAVATAADTLGDALIAHGDCEIACINSANSTTIAGPRQSIQALRAHLSETQRCLCTVLDTPFAFHSAQMDDVLEGYKQLCRTVNFATPRIPIMSPLLATCVRDVSRLQQEYLPQALRGIVNFPAAIAAAKSQKLVDDTTAWIDIGPHPVSSRFIRDLIPGAKTLASLQRGQDGVDTMMHTAARLHCLGVPVDWNAIFKPYEPAYRLLHLPSYRWDEKNHWIPYIGCWTLDKGNIKALYQKSEPDLPQALRTPSIRRIVFEELQGESATMAVITDMTQAELRTAVIGYRVNGAGVASMAIWSDLAFTVARYLYNKMMPQSTADKISMELVNFSQIQPQVDKVDSDTQLLQLHICIDSSLQQAELQWCVLGHDGSRCEEAPFASATIQFEPTPARWLREWHHISHLVSGRISSLAEMASTGQANRVSSKMIYSLFKGASIDYAASYRMMESAILHGDEGCADLVFRQDKKENWQTPPQWLDALAQVAMLVMNSGDKFDTSECVYLVNGYGSLRVGRPLESGTLYRVYVRMFANANSADSLYAGDVYLTQADQIVAVMSQVQLQRVSRSGLKDYLAATSPDLALLQEAAPAAPMTPKTPPGMQPSSPEYSNSARQSSGSSATTPVSCRSSDTSESELYIPEKSVLAEAIFPPEKQRPSQLSECMDLIAQETGLHISQLADGSNIADLGIDSLMSLALVNKFQQELQLQMNKTVFIECATIGEFKTWFQQRYV